MVKLKQVTEYAQLEAVHKEMRDNAILKQDFQRRKVRQEYNDKLEHQIYSDRQRIQHARSLDRDPMLQYEDMASQMVDGRLRMTIGFGKACKNQKAR